MQAGLAFMNDIDSEAVQLEELVEHCCEADVIIDQQ
jgi:hypothetical protein